MVSPPPVSRRRDQAVDSPCPSAGRRVVVVTGAGGFIGRHVSLALRERGHKVVGLVRPGQGTVSSDLVEDDLSDIDRLASILTAVGTEAICHCAWRGHPRSAGVDYTSQVATDVVTSANLAVASGLAEIKQFVFLSSGGAIDGTTP